VREIFPSQAVEVAPAAPVVAQSAPAATPRIKAPADPASLIATSWPLTVSADDATFVVHEPLVPPPALVAACHRFPVMTLPEMKSELV